MASVHVKSNLQAVAKMAAEIAWQYLSEAIDNYGRATWVLAGGTAPLEAYRVIAKDYSDRVDWRHVYLALGDERCVPIDHPDANWSQVKTTLLERLPIPSLNLLRPAAELGLIIAAERYEQALSALPEKQPGLPRLDHVWLGMGEDGHTLSLFPGHPALKVTGLLVVPVKGAPKPPSDRISLTLQALQGAETCLIMATGSGKAEIVARALAGDSQLPIVQAVNTIEAAGGHVTWLLDKAAASQARS